MKPPTVLHAPKESDNQVSKSLQSVLTSTYSLYLATHNYHWNVEGSQFLQLHTLFETHYNALIKDIDSIAERIRALNDYALPFEGENIIHVLKSVSNALNKETDADARAKRMVGNLILLHTDVIKHCEDTKDIAVDALDDETENLMVERISNHQKILWMLQSIIK